MTRKIDIFDTTLRDGAQSRTISFSVEDKLNIASALDSLGVAYIELGTPMSSPKDVKLFERIDRNSFKNSKLAAFGSTRRKNTPVFQDIGIKSMLDTNMDTCVIFGKSWDLHVSDILGTVPDENINMIYETVRYLKSLGKEVIFDAEHYFDGYKSNREYALSTIEAAVKAGADCITLCDTNGGSLPDEVYALTLEAVQRLCVKVGIHCHEDSGMAVASSIMAVKAGATLVQGTLIGYGERCGNANLSTIIPNLQLKCGYRCIPDECMKNLMFITRKVAEISNVSLDANLPYVGTNAFSHKAGMHSDAVLKLPRSFEHIPPDTVGNSRRIITSEMSGKSALLAKAKSYAPELTKTADLTERIINKLKSLEMEGYTFEGAEASFELMVRRETGRMESFYKLEYFKTIGDLSEHSSNDVASAIVKLRVGDRDAVNAAEGDGPVHALDLALRKTLYEFYPRLRESYLCDFKVRVLDPESATGAVVRVLMTSSDGKHTWSTIGVSADILRASYLALSDAIEYKLMKDKEEESETI
ncbi:MAG: citramalate synthase [Clostridiales bacterium]|nr:citramalate synthase [Clostridiales bacterium]